jgi:hypothetical protein
LCLPRGDQSLGKFLAAGEPYGSQILQVPHQLIDKRIVRIPVADLLQMVDTLPEPLRLGMFLTGRLVTQRLSGRIEMRQGQAFLEIDILWDQFQQIARSGDSLIPKLGLFERSDLRLHRRRDHARLFRGRHSCQWQDIAQVARVTKGLVAPCQRLGIVEAGVREGGMRIGKYFECNPLPQILGVSGKFLSVGFPQRLPNPRFLVQARELSCRLPPKEIGLPQTTVSLSFEREPMHHEQARNAVNWT